MPELQSDRYYLKHLEKTSQSIRSLFSPLGIHHRHLNEFIQSRILELSTGSKVLDGGCGLSIWVTDDIRHQYELHSMDSEEKSIEFCRKYYNDSHYLVGDLYNIPFPDDNFDAIILREVIEHIREPERAIKEMKRVLKKGGRVILTTPNYSSPLLFLVENIYNRFFSEIKPYLDDVHPSKFKFPGLRRLLEKYFSIIEYGRIDFLNIKAVVKK